MDWDRIRIFHIVASAGSFTAAGTKLGCSQSAASRQIRALEDSLNVSLFTRHARGLVLTQEGRELFGVARDMVQKIEETERRLVDSKGRTSGLLRVTTMVTFGALWLTSHLKEFMITYPDLNIDLILDDEDLDLATGEADVAVRLHEPEQADLIARPLATFHSHIYASPAYLDRRGTPVTIEDLAQHDLISFSKPNTPIGRSLERVFGREGNIKVPQPRLKVNNLYGVLQAVEAGMGIAVLPDYLVHNRRNLMRILPQVDGDSYNSYFCYAPELRGSKRVALLYEFLSQQIRAESNII